MKKLLIVAILIATSGVFAQALNEKELTALREATQTKAFETRQNAVANNSIKRLATSRRNQQGFDRNFTHVIKRRGVTDQQRSGRCWLFAGLNVVRYDAAQQLGLDDFEFSENYLFFYHKLEQANVIFDKAMGQKIDSDDPYVAFSLRNSLSDGGYWGMFYALINKYGIVPKSVMPETIHTANTGEINEVLDVLVKKHVAKIWTDRARKLPKIVLDQDRREALQEVYQVLALAFGVPPDHFDWRFTGRDGKVTPYHTYTPKTFAFLFATRNLKDQVHLINDPSLPYDNLYAVTGLRNIQEMGDETYLNVPMDVILEAITKSVLADRPVWFGADVMKFADIRNGTLDLNNYDLGAALDVSLDMSKGDRLRTYASSATHAMVLMGVDLDDKGQAAKWLVENSWGPEAGDGGYLLMTTKWFQEYGFDVVVDRKFLTAETTLMFYRPIRKIPMWGHLYRENN